MIPVGSPRVESGDRRRSPKRSENWRGWGLFAELQEKTPFADYDRSDGDSNDRKVDDDEQAKTRVVEFRRIPMSDEKKFFPRLPLRPGKK